MPSRRTSATSRVSTPIAANSSAQSEVVQLAHGVRLEVDAETERPQLGRRLVDPDGNADLVARQGHRESGDPTAGDEQLHLPRVPVGLCGGETEPRPDRAARSGNSAG